MNSKLSILEECSKGSLIRELKETLKEEGIVNIYIDEYKDKEFAIIFDKNKKRLFKEISDITSGGFFTDETEHKNLIKEQITVEEANAYCEKYAEYIMNTNSELNSLYTEEQQKVISWLNS